MQSSNRRAQLEVTISNLQGLHARPVLKFVEVASRFGSRVRVCKRDQCVDGKSPMEMMLLEGTCGTVLRIEAEGEDCHEAVEALGRLVQEKFGED
jgi:phosphocarrier protein